MSVRFFAYAALTVVTALMLIFFSRPIALWIVDLVSPKTAPVRHPVAQIAETVGDVFVRPKATARLKSVRGKAPYQIYQHDAVVVGTGSLARLFFAGGAEINVLEDSEILAEFFNADDPMSPVYLNLRRGDMEIKNYGLPGRLFIVRNKKVLSLAEWSQDAPGPSNVVAVNQEAPPVKVENAHAPSKVAQAIQSVAETEAESTAPIVDLGGEQTLSSAYIERTLSSKSGHLRRCQTNSIRDKLPAFGQMLLSIRIEPSGKVASVRPLSNTINNIHLTSCVTEVIERTKFRAFNGKPITLSYPIDFQ